MPRRVISTCGKSRYVNNPSLDGTKRIRAPVMEARNISMHYGAVQALSTVSLTIHPSEIVGLVGDNGAGKSTLIKILAGALRPSSGELLVDGRKQNLDSP